MLPAASLSPPHPEKPGFGVPPGAGEQAARGWHCKLPPSMLQAPLCPKSTTCLKKRTRFNAKEKRPKVPQYLTDVQLCLRPCRTPGSCPGPATKHRSFKERGLRSCTMNIVFLLTTFE